jgi:hypothetical protein
LVLAALERKMLSRKYTSEKITFGLLLIPAATFQMWDAVMTFFYVNLGLAVEGNPIMSHFLQTGSFISIRFFSIAIDIYLIGCLSRYSPKLAKIATACVLILYVAVVYWNYYVLYFL